MQRVQISWRRELAAQTEALNQAAVALDILFLQVIEQTAALIHHAQQTAARVVIAFMGLEMVREVLDA